MLILAINPISRRGHARRRAFIATKCFEDFVAFADSEVVPSALHSATYVNNAHKVKAS